MPESPHILDRRAEHSQLGWTMYVDNRLFDAIQVVEYCRPHAVHYRNTLDLELRYLTKNHLYLLSASLQRLTISSILDPFTLFLHSDLESIIKRCRIP